MHGARRGTLFPKPVLEESPVQLPSSPGRGRRQNGSLHAKLLLLSGAALSLAVPIAAHGQISLSSAVDLGLSNNPRIKIAQADASKAQAVLEESRDVYIPSLSAGAGLGQSYGYSPNPPTLFTFNAQSLVYNSSQFSYIRAARFGLSAAGFALQDMRETVAEDVALTFVALDHDQQREQVLRQQSDYAEKLVQIVSDRFAAGLDTQMDVTSAKLTAAQLRLGRLREQDDAANDRVHLQRLLGLPEGPLTAVGGFPSAPLPDNPASPPGPPANAAISSAFANANAKALQAFGDNHFLYRPQFSLAVVYNRYATFTNSFANLDTFYMNKSGGAGIGANEYAFGVQIGIPLLDRFRKAKGRESIADAARALHEAENAQINVLDAQSRLTHSIAELQARAEVASLEQQLAQQQLDILELRLSQPGGGPPPTPKDEQNSRIGERDKYLIVIDTAFQLHQAQISLLRQTGRLEEWLRQASLTAAPAPASPSQPLP